MGIPSLFPERLSSRLERDLRAFKLDPARCRSAVHGTYQVRTLGGTNLAMIEFAYTKRGRKVYHAALVSEARENTHAC